MWEYPCRMGPTHWAANAQTKVVRSNQPYPCQLLSLTSFTPPYTNDLYPRHNGPGAVPFDYKGAISNRTQPRVCDLECSEEVCHTMTRKTTSGLPYTLAYSEMNIARFEGRTICTHILFVYLTW